MEAVQKVEQMQLELQKQLSEGNDSHALKFAALEKKLEE